MAKKVLFPTDGSIAARRTAELASSFLGDLQDIEVTVLVAVSLYDESEADYGEEFVRTRNTWMRQKAERATAQAVAVFAENGIKAEALIVEGDPVSAAISEEAKNGDYDLIVMGSRGLSLEKEQLSYVGSVTQHVLRRVSIPVLVIPAQPED
jgi:nucleotide-binding universal stress UspA family protein